MLPLLPQVMLEEFGKFINATVGADINQRNQYYGIIFDEINKLASSIKVSLMSSSIIACMCERFSMAFAHMLSQMRFQLSSCRTHVMIHLPS